MGGGLDRPLKARVPEQDPETLGQRMSPNERIGPSARGILVAEHQGDARLTGEGRQRAIRALRRDIEQDEVASLRGDRRGRRR
jgi:hypothetical protein